MNYTVQCAGAPFATDVCRAMAVDGNLFARQASLVPLTLRMPSTLVVTVHALLTACRAIPSPATALIIYALTIFAGIAWLRLARHPPSVSKAFPAHGAAFLSSHRTS